MKDQGIISDKFLIRMDHYRKDSCPIKSNCLLELFGPTGVLKQTQFVHNDIYLGARYGLVDQCADAPALPVLGWTAVGTGVIAAAPGDFTNTKLTTEIARVAMTSKIRATNVLTTVTTFSAGTGTGVLTEIGTFDVVTANTVHIWMGATINITKGAADTLTVTWTLTVT